LILATVHAVSNGQTLIGLEKYKKFSLLCLKWGMV